MFRAGLGVAHWLAKAFPEDADEDVTAVDPEKRIDQALRTEGMKTRVRVRLPSAQLQPQAMLAGDTPVDVVHHPGQEVALGLDVTGRSDHYPEDFGLFSRVHSMLPSRRLPPPAAGQGANSGADLKVRAAHWGSVPAGDTPLRYTRRLTEPTARPLAMAPHRISCQPALPDEGATITASTG